MTDTLVDPATSGPGHDHYEVQGHPVDVPLHVDHARTGMAVHTCDTDALIDWLPAALAPVELRPGRSILLLMAVRYVDNPLGDYAEGVVASVVREYGTGGAFASLRDVAAGRYGIFVHHMPVSQAFTREAGERVWGFPKTLDTVEIVAHDRRVGLRWAAQADAQQGGQEQEVLRLSLPRGGQMPVPPQAGTAYTLHDDTVWRTRLTMHGHGARIGPGGARLRLGTHPVADRLRALDLSRRALATSWVEHATMDFESAEALP